MGNLADEGMRRMKGGDTSEDEDDESPDGDAGICGGVDLVNGSGAAVEEYGGKDDGDSEDGCWESESGIMPLNKVNSIQGLYNETRHCIRLR